tara:strand:+ start:1345 stop:1971 length:627 start_codon:yes stop_codon:yes gene_type:complete
MDEIWIYCDMCEEESPHEVLKSRTSNKRGFSFQGIVKCNECGSKRHAEIKEERPLSLKLRISDDDQTLNGNLDVDRGVLLKVGQTRPHPDGLIVITSLELADKRPDEVFSQEMPIIWAKRATHAKIRFAIHEGESTISLKKEFESSEEFYVGMHLQLQGRSAKVRSINLFGGKSVRSSFASDISRITCAYLPKTKHGRGQSKIGGRRN